jgi:prepilin-type N-terminal cleavage/methylation domain-containing protein
MSSTSDTRTAHARAGFTLIEVMVSLGVLAFGLLTLAVMQLQALSHGSRGRHTTDAAAAARSALEQVHRVPWSVLSATQALGGWQDPNWTSAQATVASQVNVPAGGGVATEQSYAVAWRVTDVGAAPTCLRDVEVRVRWTDEGSPEKSLVMATRRYNWGNAGC